MCRTGVGEVLLVFVGRRRCLEGVWAVFQVWRDSGVREVQFRCLGM